MKKPFKILHREKPKKLSGYVMPRGKDKQGYKYLIHSYGGTSHTAFKTKSGFDKYLDETGQKVVGKIKPGESFELKGKHQYISIGAKKWRSLNQRSIQPRLDRYAKAEGMKPIKVLDNGSYVRGYKEKKKNITNIWYVNPNYKPRKLKYRHN